MFHSLSAVSALLVSVIFLSVGQGLHQALVPVAANAFDFSTVIISSLSATFFLGFLAGCLLVPLLIRRVGHTRCFGVFSAAVAAFSTLHILIPHEIAWLGFRFMAGLCFAAMDVVMESWLADRAPTHARGRVMSTYRFLRLSFIGLGQFFVSAADPTTFTLFAIISIVICFGVVPSGLSASPAPTRPAESRVRVSRVFRKSPLGAITSFLHGSAMGIYWGLAPFYLSGVPHLDRPIGQILAATMIAAAVIQIPVGFLSDRFDRRILLTLLAGTGSGAAGLILWVSTTDPNLIIWPFILFGFTGFSVFAVAITHAMDKSPKHDLVEIGSTLFILYAIGAIIGPASLPMLYDVIGQPAPMVAITVIYGLVCLYAVSRWMVKAPVAPEDQRAHMNVPLTTPAVMNLDPIDSRPKD